MCIRSLRYNWTISIVVWLVINYDSILEIWSICCDTSVSKCWMECGHRSFTKV